MKNLLVLVLTVLFTVNASAQIETKEAYDNLIINQHDYNRHIDASDKAFDVLLGGAILGGIGLVINEARGQNVNYDTKFMKYAGNTCIILGSSATIVGASAYFGHRRKAEKINVKF